MRYFYTYVLLFLSMLIGSISLAQHALDDYFLNALDLTNEEFNTRFRDSTFTSYFTHSDKSHSQWGDHKKNHIDNYAVKVRSYDLMAKNYDNWTRAYFRKGKLYLLDIEIYFDGADSLACVTAFKELLETCWSEISYDHITQGTSQRLLEVSNGQELQLTSPIKTPIYYFYLDKKKRSYFEVRYSYSDGSGEYSIEITFMNTRLI